MSQTEPTQEAMQRIRANLSRRGDSGRAFPFPLKTVEGPSGEPPLPAEQAVSDFPAFDLSSLRNEVDGALAGHKMVGQANPRPSGIHNRAVQFVKRAMLRVLTFYTRPLHYFQSSVIRALQNIVVALRAHDDELQDLKRALQWQSEAVRSSGRQNLATAKAAQAGTQRVVAANEKLVALVAGQNKLQKQIAEVDDDMQGLLGEQKRLAVELKRLDGMARAFQEESRVLIERHGSQQENLAALAGSVDEQYNSLRQSLAALADSADERDKNLLNRIEAHETRLEAVPSHLERIAAMERSVASVQEELGRVHRQLQDVTTRARLHDRDLRRYVNEMLTGKTDSTADTKEPPVPAMFSSGTPSDGSFDYFRFEELHRGDEGLIAERQRAYLEYFRGRDNVVDLGCGRGEFLELLRENGIRAKGIEIGTDQYLLCKEKGLDVTQQDLFSFLETVKDGTLGGIFSAQVIEHMTASDQLRLVRLTYRKTTPGSPVILETINAQSVFAIVRNFFLDPTHVRPVHPETMKLAMESAKFHDVELRYSSLYTERRIPVLKVAGDGPQLEEFNRAVGELNDLVYGYLDYAAIGWH